MKLVNLLPLKEESTGAFGATSEELADIYSLQMLQQMRDEVMMDMEQQAEPEGGPIADMYGGQLNGLDKAIAIKRGETKDVPYDVAIGRMTQDEYDKMMSTVKPDRASFEKSSKFDRMNEATEKSWSAIDVSRKAEKEISNKEWNERTAKKLDMLKKLNDAGKFKKDFDDERLQGWVDQNYSWQKLSKQFKLNEMYNRGTVSLDGKEVDTSSIEMGGLDSMRKYGPDDGGPDAYIESAYFLDGTELTDIQRDEFMDKYPDITHEKAVDQMYQQEGAVEEGSCGYGPDGVPGDTPGETRGMPANKRTMGMMREVIRKEIKRLHENK